MKNSNKKTLLAAALIMGGLVHGPLAQAGPTGQELDLTFPNNHSALFPAGGNVMGISFNDGSKSRSVNVKAGMFSGSADPDRSTFDIAKLYLDGNNVLVYCVDILMNLRKQSTIYDVNMISQGEVVTQPDGVRRDFGRMLTFLGAVNHVLSGTYYGLGFGDKNWLNPSSGGWMAGAIQVGIWESLYEKEGNTLSILDSANGSTDYFSATSVNPLGHDLLTAAFGRMDTATPLSVDQVVWLSSDQGQDLLADPVDVPVPAPLILLASGLGVLVLRRRKTASTGAA